VRCRLGVGIINDGGLGNSNTVGVHVRDSHHSSNEPRSPKIFFHPIYSDVSLSEVTTKFPHAPGTCALGMS
jgi:hypothetical protein